jgi:hypothetical protein
MRESDLDHEFTHAVAVYRAGARCGHSPKHDGTSCGAAPSGLIVVVGDAGLIAAGVECASCAACPEDHGSLKAYRRKLPLDA